MTFSWKNSEFLSFFLVHGNDLHTVFPDLGEAERELRKNDPDLVILTSRNFSAEFHSEKNDVELLVDGQETFARYFEV
jgi:hypothetical protein